MNIHLNSGHRLTFKELSYLVATAVHDLHNWEKVIKPLVSATVDEMLATGKLPIRIADAFDDIGQFCMKLGQEIMFERTRRNMPMPPGPDY